MSQVNNSQHPHHKSKQSVVINSVLKDEKSWQTELDDTESNQKNKSKEAKEHEKEIAKWKKAYFHEKQNHKATKEVLDQALALSMKLLEEVKTLDVKLPYYPLSKPPTKLKKFWSFAFFIFFKFFFENDFS